MKRIILLMTAFITVVSLHAQDKPASPKAEVAGTIGATNVKIVYSQPSARGRKIMGGLVPFGEVWRTGANEATTVEFDKPVKVEDKDLAAGKYELFTIPGENEWVVIFQKHSKQWGAYSYKQANDVLRVTVKPSKTAAFVEVLTLSVEKDGLGLKWENTAIAVKVK